MLKQYLSLVNRIETHMEKGQGLVEYALILVLVSIAVIALLTILGGRVNDVFQRISDELVP